MTKRGRFGSKRLGKASRPRPNTCRPQVEALEARGRDEVPDGVEDAGRDLARHGHALCVAVLAMAR
ncbi:MAG TPA: hypothetical protein VKD72_30670, partial [Gemmataceae bacterium]|nr:hypothetical protein [Gemmataceae bacterium]